MIGIHKFRNIAVFGGLVGLVLVGMTWGAGAETLDELYKKALKEGGTVNFYGTLAQINAERILRYSKNAFPASRSITSMPPRTSSRSERSLKPGAAGY